MFLQGERFRCSFVSLDVSGGLLGGRFVEDDLILVANFCLLVVKRLMLEGL